MEQMINTQLEVIEKSIKWVEETDSMRGPNGEVAYRNLVNLFRELDKKTFALEGNPAAAIYGGSQMGKSYLVSNLLSESGTPFTVIDGSNNPFIYLDEINPEGKKKEATSLVTRFSTNYEWKNPAFPVKAKLLSPADLVLVLCDSYYNDVKTKNDMALKSDAISEKVLEIYNKHADKTTQQMLFGKYGIAVLNMKDYFDKNFQTKAMAQRVKESGFFDKIAPIIEKTEPNEWCEIFSLLWNNNEKITQLFSQLLTQYAKLNFSDEIYLPIAAVLRNNGTILDVMRLQEINGDSVGTEQNYQADTTIMVLKNGQESIINNFSKSYLCALTAELTFRLPKGLEDSKPFLKNTDLLDFPGARNRLGRHEEELVDEDIPQMLLRGKVAYLFNKYSYSEKINILLFCQNGEQSELQNILPDLLNDWIGDMIGNTREERNMFIEKSKVPPLFVISTMFNIDLQFDFNNDKPANMDARINRWKGRFVRVLGDVFGSKKWLTEWTTNNSNFQNIYLLRDFRFSSDTESKLFKGYNENKVEMEEIVHDTYPDFRKDLRQSFIEYPFVKQHFENPENSWDRAAKMNEDGAQLIIDNLTTAANNINTARREKIIRELNAMVADIVKLLKDKYNSPDKAEELLKAIRTAGRMQAKLDSAFGRDHYFFGPMMKELMLNNTNVYHLYHEKIRDIEHRDVTNVNEYSGIRNRVPEINSDHCFDTNLERLRVSYGQQTLKECQDFFEQEVGIDLNELFYGKTDRVKNFSQVLADALETYWFEEYMLENRQPLVEIFSEDGLQNIQDMLRRLFKKLQISEIIAKKIRQYVEGSRSNENVYEIIADISAETVNKFINSVGLEYYNESHFNDLKAANANIESELIWEHNDLQFTTTGKEDIVELIDDMSNLDELLNQNPLPAKAKRLPYYRSYIIWGDLLKVGFATVSGVPDYDPIANEKLGKIIEQCETIKY